MKEIQFIFLIFIFYYCICANLTCDNNGKYHIIDNTSPNYEYDIELDWTDIDDKTINVPFVDLQENEIIPLFVNGSYLKFYESNERPITNEENIYSLQYDMNIIPNLYTISSNVSEFSVENNNLKILVKSNGFKANEKDVKKKYIKYFCWYECENATNYRFRKSGIIVVVNKSNFLKLNQFLIGFLLLLL